MPIEKIELETQEQEPRDEKITSFKVIMDLIDVVKELSQEVSNLSKEVSSLKADIFMLKTIQTPQQQQYPYTGTRNPYDEVIRYGGQPINTPSQWTTTSTSYPASQTWTTSNYTSSAAIDYITAEAEAAQEYLRNLNNEDLTPSYAAIMSAIDNISDSVNDLTEIYNEDDPLFDDMDDDDEDYGP